MKADKQNARRDQKRPLLIAAIANTGQRAETEANINAITAIVLAETSAEIRRPLVSDSAEEGSAKSYRRQATAVLRLLMVIRSARAPKASGG
jgi:hypothetical protein